VAAGAVMAVVHIVAHLGRLQIVGYQDLLIGYPMATVLVLVGLLFAGAASKA
jgi:hypothetical protein